MFLWRNPRFTPVTLIFSSIITFLSLCLFFQDVQCSSESFHCCSCMRWCHKVIYSWNESWPGWECVVFLLMGNDESETILPPASLQIKCKVIFQHKNKNKKALLCCFKVMYMLEYLSFLEKWEEGSIKHLHSWC